jgi:hypothetical protein
VLVICRGTHSISYLDDSPIQGASFDEHLISLPINIFLAGDLAFLSTLLGKENMSTAWCPWCILSKVQWSASNHKPGQLWTIDNIVDICEKVDWKELSEDPELLRGFTKLPLFDLIPIQNYIVPVLHILIGVGNAVVNAIYGFVDEHIERLLKQLIVARNNINTAKINLEDAQAEHDDWIQNDGITLSDYMLEKGNIIQQLKARNDNGSLVIQG